jgi:hypothetical protein
VELGLTEMGARGVEIGGPGGEIELGHRPVGMEFHLVLHGAPSIGPSSSGNTPAFTCVAK